MARKIRMLGDQFLRFSGVGIVGTSAHYTVLACLVYVGGVDPVLGSACGFVTGAFVNYLLNYRYTFHSNVSHIAGLPKFLTVALVGLVLNSIIISVATWVIGLNFAISQVLATVTVLMWNFAGNRAWTFRDG